MPRALPNDISFETWVEYIFDHPVTDPAWHWDDDGENYQHWNAEASPSRTLDYLTRLFSDPKALSQRYSGAQIDQGLYLLVNPSCSNYMFSAHDTSIPWERREKLIRAMVPLYEVLMGPVYSNPEVPNNACYMWWDVIPLYGGMDHPDSDRINDAVIAVFQAIAGTSWMPCLESVLHGLGHWHHYVPQRTAPIVDCILARTDLPEGLRRYAEQAREGGVL